MNQLHEEAMRRLELLKQDYEAQLGDRIAEIVDAWQTAMTASDPTSALQTLLRQVHSMAGTAGVFGMREISCTAAALEEALDQQLSSLRPEVAEMLATDSLVQSLKMCYRNISPDITHR